MCDVCCGKGYVRVFEGDNPDPRYFLTGCGKFNDEQMLRREGATGFYQLMRRTVGMPPRLQEEVILGYEFKRISSSTGAD